MNNNSPSFIFFGTPEFAVRVLQGLKKHSLAPRLIITAPSRPQGRGLIVVPPAVKEYADANKIRCLQPEKIADAVTELINSNADVFVVAAYGAILSNEVLSIPSKGAINIHPSLLPKYRGASPIESAILRDDRDTGVSLMLMDEKMDHGPIIAQWKLSELEQGPAWPLSSAEAREIFADHGAELLVKAFHDIKNDCLLYKEQEHARATYTKKIEKNDGCISLDDDPYKNFLKYKALTPRPGIYFFEHWNEGKKRIIIKQASFHDGQFIPVRVVPEGGKEMEWSAYQRGKK